MIMISSNYEISIAVVEVRLVLQMVLLVWRSQPDFWHQGHKVLCRYRVAHIEVVEKRRVGAINLVWAGLGWQ